MKTPSFEQQLFTKLFFLDYNVVIKHNIEEEILNDSSIPLVYHVFILHRYSARIMYTYYFGNTCGLI